MQKSKKILLINFGGLGDEILFLPTIETVRRNYPKATIFLALEPRSRAIGELSQSIDELIEIDIKGKQKYFNLLKLILFSWFQRFDIIISSGANKSIPLLLTMMFPAEKYGYDSGFLAKKLLTKAVPLKVEQYAAKMYRDLVSHLKDTNECVPKIELEEISKIPNSILIHPGVSKMSIQKNIIKIFGANVWAEIIEQLINKGKKIILAGGPDDGEIIGQILEILKSKNLNKSENFVNIYGKTRSVKDLCRRIKEAEILLCSDSAPMHIGVGVGTKTYAIFGPTDEKKLLPKSENFVALTVDCLCRPCLWDKRQTSCEKQYCLNFTAENIVNTII